MKRRRSGINYECGTLKKANVEHAAGAGHAARRVREKRRRSGMKFKIAKL